MPAHAVGADHHDRAHGIARRLLQFRVRMAAGLLGLDLLPDGRLDRIPIAVEGGDELVMRENRLAARLPGRTFDAFLDRRRGLVQAGEEIPPFGIDRSGIAGIVLIELFGIGGVGGMEKGGQRKGIVGGRARRPSARTVLPIVAVSACHPILRIAQRVRSISDICAPGAPFMFSVARLAVIPGHLAFSAVRRESCRAGPAKARLRCRPLSWRQFWLRRPPCRPK